MGASTFHLQTLNSNFTFTSLLQTLHGSKSKFALQKQEKPRSGFFPHGF
jgi:hypothetical protein